MQEPTKKVQISVPAGSQPASGAENKLKVSVMSNTPLGAKRKEPSKPPILTDLLAGGSGTQVGVGNSLEISFLPFSILIQALQLFNLDTR